MKKIIIGLILLFSLTPVRAALVYFDTDDPFVLPGETISISIFSTVETIEIQMDRIGDNGGGIASNLYLNPGYEFEALFNEGVAINSGGVLIEDVRGSIGLDAPYVSGILYSFDYTVSLEAVNEQTISIFADLSGGAINEINIIGPGDNVIPESLTLTVVPEPTTLLLLAFGTLFLRKHEKQKPNSLIHST